MAARTRLFSAVDRGVETTWKRAPDLVFWLFMAGTALWLGWMGASDLNAHLVQGVGGISHTSIFRVANGGEAWTAPGLTYDGTLGSVIALFEAGAVIFGLLMLHSRKLGRRVGGVMIVVAWAALWAGNAAAFAAKSGGGLNWILAAGYTLPLAATAIVGMRKMGGRGRAPRRRLRLPVRSRSPRVTVSIDRPEPSAPRQPTPTPSPRTAEASMVA